MNSFSKNIYIEFLLNYPDLIFENESYDELLLLNITNFNNAKIGNLVVLTLEDNSIWIQNHFENSAYSIDNFEELKYILNNIFKDSILWVIANKNKIWFETTLINNVSQIEKEPNVTYEVFSWSGKNDHIL
ncbi:hypothetical protein [Flavobacterium sp.]|uniref:hypothetical protein n=1 Tax=Flavobacterium sp. TaxID=239 RepID=UPI003753758C